MRITSLLLLLIYSSITSVSLYARTTRVIGLVTDSITGEPLKYVNVMTKSGKRGTVTDEKGIFTLSISSSNKLTASSLGYKSLTLNVSEELKDTLRFKLSPKEEDLEEVVIKPKKEKYSKKNNPAVDLMQRIRKDRDKCLPTKERYYSYNKYDKMILGLNDFNTLLSGTDNKFKNKIKFLETFVDTAIWTGKRVLDLSFKEKTSMKIIGNDPKVDKEIITGIRSFGIDESINQDNIRIFLEDVLREINVYSNDITLMQNRFVSPLSSIGADYYMYHITDTLPVAGERCIELSFAPKNPESFGFNGKIFIPVNDSIKYVKRVSMRVPKAINLNYVDNLFLSQNFRRDSIGNIHKTLDDICLELQIMPGTPKFYVSRQTRYDGFSYEMQKEYSDYYSMIGNSFELDNATKRSDEYWDRSRQLKLTYAESQMGSMMTQMRKVPLLYWSEKAIALLEKGYVTTGQDSKFDIGPLNTMISYNTAEGVRFRVGGMTTANLSKHLFARGYVAYGLKDKKFKYSGELEYSFNEKKYHSREFPMNSIRATYQYDKDQLGQHYIYTNADNIFLSVKRMKSDLITYKKLAKLEYNLELNNNLSFNIGYYNEEQEATPWINFTTGTGSEDKHFRQGAFFATIRYAPGEKYVQAASYRLPVNSDAPVFILTHEYGPQRFIGADFTLNKTELSIGKRFWFSAFGYTDIILKGGKIWSQVQFPALLWQNANISYTIQPESYSLLNPMEFAMDQYASLDMQYFINGAILNRIPGVNKLKLREIITFKGFVGSLTKKNNPEYNDNLYRFPATANTGTLGKAPYMEIGVGLDNILTFLRLDYVWRLTYRDRPGIDKSGLRLSLHFTF